MRRFGFLPLLLCAEWLLIFRIWVSFRYLLLFILFGALRLRLLAFIPHWENHYTVLPLALIATLYNLRCVFNGSSARNREISTTPDTGVPWLVIVAKTKKAAQFLEFVIMGAFLYYMMQYGTLVYPAEFGALPPAWQAWLADGIHAELFIFAYFGLSMCGLAFWSLLEAGVPLWKPKTPTSADAYQHVQEVSHATPRLPSVKELADELRQFYG